MDEGKRQKRPRRSFTDEFKAGAVRLVLDEGKTIPQVARDLDLTMSALRQWVERARADRTQGRTGLTTAGGEPQPRGPVDAQRGAAGADAQALPLHDNERSRPAGGGQSPRPALRG